MPQISVREAVPADIPAIVDVHFGAFGPSVMNQLMHPGGVTADAKAKFGATLFPPPGDGSKPGSEVRHWVAELRPEPGQPGDAKIIAFAKWNIFRTQRPEEEWNAEPKAMTNEMLGEGSSAEAFNWFIGGLHKKARPLIRGEANAYLGILACLPEFHGLGAGSALLRRGCEFADSLGLPSWLVASPEGYPVYKKFGYQDVAVMDFDVTGDWGITKTEAWNWGATSALDIAGPLPEGHSRSVFMRRPAKPE
ncbi:puromycin N-acetyltransferase [Podospora conica]|nr:puromycin N-acetyltransferase [Schizothecium conicum]